MSVSESPSRTPDHHAIEKQPKALYILFFAELWERFSFYGMRALLVLYMTKELVFSEHNSYGILGAYGALVYGSNILGGYLADNFLGNRQAVIIGSFFIILGHIILALPLEEHSFFYGLAFLVVGTGFFKPNVSSFLGQFYHKDDSRRDGGFTIFYMGINVGALFAPLVCGTVGELYGWHYGFGLAAIGMLSGAVVFYGGYKHFGSIGLPPFPEDLKRPILLGLSLSKTIVLGSLLFVPLVVFMLQNHHNMGSFLTIAGLIVFIIISMVAFKSPIEERKCIFTLLLMFVFVASFFAIFEQLGGSLLLFTEKNISREFLGMTIPASWSQSLNPAFIILFSPLVASLWSRLGKYNLEPMTPYKFLLGFLMSGFGFYLFVLGIQSHFDGFVNILWLVAGTAFFTLGELFISPVGLSMVTKLAPARIGSLMMGTYFFSHAFSHFLAQKIAQVFGAPEGVDVKSDIMASLAGFESIFTFVSQFAFASAGALLIMIPLIYRTFKRHS